MESLQTRCAEVYGDVFINFYGCFWRLFEGVRNRFPLEKAREDAPATVDAPRKSLGSLGEVSFAVNGMPKCHRFRRLYKFLGA